MKIHYLVGILACIACTLPSQAKVAVITASTDLAALTREIGGAHVQVESLARGDQDLHRIEPRPSFVVKLAQAQLVVRLGMDLDLWMDALLAAAKNAQVREGGKGYVDASTGITRLEVPSGRIDGSHGDIHIEGNPHYWLDPENGKCIARNILAGLQRVDAKHAADYQANYARFAKQLDQHLATWRKAMDRLQGAKVVTYHTTWSYFNKRFGLTLAGTVEPKPGIPPSAAHISALIATIKREGVKTVMTASYYPTRHTDLLKREAGVRVLVLPTSVGGAKGVDTYFDLFDRTVELLTGQ